MTVRAHDLAALPPVPTVLVINNTTVELSPLRVGELPRFIQTIDPIRAELAAQLQGEPDWLQLLGTHGETVLAAVALAVRRERGWIDALALDEAIQLAAAVFEVNADFFIRRVSPALTQAAARIGQAITATTAAAAGRPPSPASSAPATATPTS